MSDECTRELRPTIVTQHDVVARIVAHRIARPIGVDEVAALTTQYDVVPVAYQDLVGITQLGARGLDPL